MSSGDYGFQLLAALYPQGRVLQVAGSELAAMSTAEATSRLEGQLDSHFEQNPHGAVVLTDVDLLHAQVAYQVLWRYCDSDNAPAKHALIYTTLSLPGLPACPGEAEEGSENGSEEAALVEQAISIVRESWEQGGQRGSVKPLWVRLSNDMLLRPCLQRP